MSGTERTAGNTDSGRLRVIASTREGAVVNALFLVSLVVTAPQGENEVTAAEKTAFFELLATLEIEGEFFTDEAVKKMLPHMRVLLALTAKDLEKYDVYPFLALSGQLAKYKEARASAARQYSTIAHSLLQLSWAVDLFETEESTVEVVKHLKKVVDSEKGSKVLDEMLGPKSEDFKKRVKEARVKEK